MVSVADNNLLDLGNGPLSLEAWIKLSATGTPDYIIGKSTGAYGLRVSGTGTALVFSRVGQATLATSTGTMDTTHYHYVVVTYAGANGPVTFYIDGINAGVSSPASNLVDNTLSLGIGSGGGSGPTAPFHGTIDEAAVYNIALTSTQVAAHYAAGK